jgi:hypothetical protein
MELKRQQQEAEKRRDREEDERIERRIREQQEKLKAEMDKEQGGKKGVKKERVSTHIDAAVAVGS